MISRISALCLAAVIAVQPLTAAPASSNENLYGYSAAHSATERDWESKFRNLPDPATMRSNMQRMSARPHNVGSPYDKENAEWMLAQFKQYGFDAHIETFDVLFPTPKERHLELIAPTRFVAKLQEGALSVDPTSQQTAEQLPTYNAYSHDGDVTAPLVYVNYGMREDYEELDRLGISVKGAIVIARYGEAGAASSPRSLPSTEPSAASSTPIPATTATSTDKFSPPAPTARPTACSAVASWIPSTPVTH